MCAPVLNISSLTPKMACIPGPRLLGDCSKLLYLSEGPKPGMSRKD